MASQRRSSRRSGSLLNRAVEALEVRRLLVFTGSVSGTTAIFTGDSAGDTLTIDQSGGLLRHNRAGDPGFNSGFDFDSSAAGDQTLAANSATTLTANCGDGNDNITTGDGNDLISGGRGDDHLDAFNGRNIIFGGPGNDRFHTRDGEVDKITCGDGLGSGFIYISTDATGTFIDTPLASAAES